MSSPYPHFYDAGPNKIPKLTKRRTIVYISFALLIEFISVFTPYGPIDATLNFINQYKATKALGLNPCINCGMPTVLVTYTSAQKTVVRNDWCQKCAPSTLDLASSIIEGLGFPLKALMGYLLMSLGFAITIIDLKQTIKDPDNSFYGSVVFALIGLATLLLFGFGFFWSRYFIE